MKNFLFLFRDICLSNFNLNNYPYKLTFAITYRCNYKCIQCRIWNKKPKKEMSVKQIESFVKKFPHFKWINLTGGEPFLRRDLIKIVETFIKNSHEISLINTTTNGFNPRLISNDVLEILEFNPSLLIVVVSLDGYKELHEKIRGVRNSFENAIKTFSVLKKISEKNKNFKTFFGYTITPFNLGEFKKTYLEVKKRVKNLSISDFHFNIYHTSIHYYGNFEKKTKLNENQLLEDINFVSRFKKISFTNPIGFLEKKYVDLAKNYVKCNKTPLPCKVIQTSIFIDPYGNVFPCTIWNLRIGNLRDFNYDLNKILKLKKVKKLKKVIRMLKCPNCWTPCEAYQTILGNLFKICL